MSDIAPVTPDAQIQPVEPVTPPEPVTSPVIVTTIATVQPIKPKETLRQEFEEFCQSIGAPFEHCWAWIEKEYHKEF